ncbi:MAG: prenyltransferase [Bacteroidaceae bacterium]|nr:prenyltransferase [Bacteroidaceae bacterium]
MKHSAKEWIIATRPWSFPASSTPVILTLAWLFWRGENANWLLGLWALLTMVAFQAVGNTWSDYFDYKHHVDAADTYGSRNLTSGLFSMSEMMRLSVILAAVVVASGIGLVWFTGWQTLALGVAGMLLFLCYPWLKYHALGDVDIFLCYALLPILGTTFVATGQFLPEALVVSPAGLITVGILHANNARDVVTDKRADTVTLPILFGVRFARWAYYFEVISPYIWVAIFAATSLLPPLCVLMTLLSVGRAARLTRAMSKLTDTNVSSIINLDEKTAQHVLLFSLLLSLGLVLADFLAVGI